LQNAKFTKKADVFAAGIIFLELITLSSPKTLYNDLWPRVLQMALPPAMKKILSMSLAAEPESRTGSFNELLSILRSDEGKVIGELRNDADLAMDVSTIVEILHMPSSPVADERSWSVILKD
jgi:serine/threonine protein kinase